MDTDISNGSSDSAASGTALLSRKGLFGKSGVLNQNLDTSIAIHQDPSKLEHAKAKMDADEHSTMELGEQNTSSVEPSAPELSPEGQNILQDDEPMHDSEHSNANESGDTLEMAEGDVPCPMEADEKPDATEADAPQASTCSEDEPKEAEEGRKEDEEVDEEDRKRHSKEDDPHADAGGDHVDEDSGEEPDAPKAHVSSPEPSSDDRVEEAEIVEEVCVTKIISMDTDDTDDVAGIQLPSESTVAPSTDEDEDDEPRPTSEDVAEEVSNEEVEAAFEEQPEEDEDEKEEEEYEEEKEEEQGKEEEKVDGQEALTNQESEDVHVSEKAEHDVEQKEEEEGEDEKEEEEKALEQEDVHKDDAQSHKEDKNEEEEEDEEEQEREKEGEEERREEETEKTKETDESCLVESADAEENDQAESTTIEEAQPVSENEGAMAADAEESEQIDDEPEQGKTAEETTEAGDDGEEEEDKTSAPRRRSSSRRAPSTPASAKAKPTPRASARAKTTPAVKATPAKATPAKATAAKASPAPKATPVTKAISAAKSTPATKAASTVKAPKSTPAPKSAPRAASRRRHEEEEKADDEEKPEMTPKRRKSMDTKKNEENVVESRTPLKRGRRSVAEETKKTPATPATPTPRGRKSAKKDAVAEAEDENEPEPDQKSVGRMRGRSAKERKEEPKMEATPEASATRRGRSRNSEKEAESKKETKVAEEATPRRGRKSPAATPAKPAKAAKTPKSQAKKEQGDEEHDPYDIDTEMERHPEPLKNIQMEVQSFGEVKYAKVGSGKYERTEKTAEQRVGNLAEMTPRAKQRKSLADLTPGRKKATASGGSTAPQSSRRSRKGVKEEADNEEAEEAMEVDGETQEKTTPKRKGKAEPTPSKSAQASGRKRRGTVETPAVPSKRSHVEVPQLGPDELLAVDHPHDEHAPYEAGARVYAMFDGLFYPAIVVSRDGLGRFKVHFIEDNVVKDVPPAGVIPLRALDAEKECYYAASAEKDRVAVKVLSEPNAKSASAWFEADFELERLDDEGNPTGKKLKAVWTQLALSKDDWKDYINKKSREATDVIADNIESTEDRQLRRSKTATPSQPAIRRGKSTPKVATEETSSSAPAKTGRGGRQKKGAQKAATSKEKSAAEEETEGTTEDQNEQIFTGKLFILTSANRPNTDTGFKKKFMTDFISSHGGLVVDDMKEVDEHPEMERFLISDTHYRTHKYLAALVRAMPCVSHEWIYTCLNEKKLVDYKPFLLPSGVSILDEQEYPLPTERGLLLRNKRVMVHSNVTPPSKKSMSFEQIWVPMVPQLGGEIVTDMPNGEGQLDILLTDHSATPSIVEKARKIGCIVVSSEWLIQGIIMDRLPDVNAHQKFLHNGGICT